MKLIKIDSIEKKDHPLDYKRYYNAKAVFESVMDSVEEIPIQIMIEHTPLGPTKVDIELKTHPKAGPILMATKQIKEKVMQMDKEGVFD
ncbi:hypothetical protein WKV44_08390 [Spirochaetia bacterium 38H-sp]|uniref:Uncharacterized protein n=1 Tax=Rarispira pelagica TaxID=3141764 RepID=A0ABU9UD14_9SPIR